MDERDFPGFLARLRQGDPDAWSELVEQFDDWLRLRIRASLRQMGVFAQAGASDVVQSTYRRFFENGAAGQFHSMADLRRQLVTIGLNRVIDHARRKRLAVLPAGREPSDPRPTPGHQLEQRDRIERFLSRLTPEERQLFEWRAIDGLSWLAIAQRLGQPVAMVRTMEMSFNRTRRRILNEMDDAGE